MTAEQIAAVCHEANRAYCRSTGDISHAPWKKVPKELKASIIKGVEYKIGNPGVTPKESHESWARQKKIDGWKYGPEKSFVKKEHPNLVPYSELSEYERKKDELFLAIINVLK